MPLSLSLPLTRMSGGTVTPMATEPEQPLPPHRPIERYYADEAERRPFVTSLFDGAASHYDWINRLMSFGSGIWYRREALRRVGVAEGMTVVDVATGSGQVARAAEELVGPSGRVVPVDLSLGMLVEARRFVSSPAIRGVVEWLPLASGIADVVSMGYALRHVADLRATFCEYHRVLRPGGRVLLLEFARPTSAVGYALLRLYLGFLIPAVARLRGHSAKVMMRYFWDTIDACVPPETILDVLAAAGFEEQRREGQAPLFAEYVATRPAGG